jgi:hypothetical protein
MCSQASFRTGWGPCSFVRSELSIRDGTLEGHAETEVRILGWIRLPDDQKPSMKSIKRYLRSQPRHRIECRWVPNSQEELVGACEKVWPMPFACRTSNPFDFFRILAPMSVRDFVSENGGGTDLPRGIIQKMIEELEAHHTPPLSADEARELWALPDAPRDVASRQGVDDSSPVSVALPSIKPRPNDTPAERHAKARLATFSRSAG